MNNYLRTKYIFSLIALLVLGAGIGVLHQHALDSGSPFIIRDAVRTIVAPVDLASYRVFAIGGWFERVARPRSRLLRENARLRREVRRLDEENAELHEAAAENLELRRIVGLRQSTPMGLVTAEVVSRKASSWLDTVTIDAGTRSGVYKGAAVIDSRGLVGQVIEADALTAQVVSLSDLNSAVGAMVQRSRVNGMAQGQGDGSLVLAYLPKDADVKEGDVVISSGIGQVIPKGFVIGRVTRVVPSPLGTTSALVRPSVRFDQLEMVSVIKNGQGAGK